MTPNPDFEHIVSLTSTMLNHRNLAPVDLRISYDAIGRRSQPGVHQFSYFIDGEELGYLELIDSGQGSFYALRMIWFDDQVGETQWFENIAGPDGRLLRLN